MAKKKVSKKKTIENKEVNKFKFNLDFFDNKNMKYIKFILPFLLILIVMFMAFYIRSGPINLDGLNSNVQSTTYNNIKNIISQQVGIQYPNLNPTYRQELIDKEFKKVLDTGKFNYNGQEIEVDKIIEQNIKNVKSSFQADNGQTYLNAIDPYHFLHITENYVKNGYRGDTLKEVNGKIIPYISYKLAPNGLPTGYRTEFHVLFESFMFKLYNVDENSDIGEKTQAIFLIPVILVLLSVIPIFLILKRFSNDVYAFFGSLFLISIGTFVSRTIAGFVDTDGYTVLFPLIIIAFLVYGFIYKNKYITILLASIAGFFQGLFLLAWGPGVYIFAFILITLLAYIGYIFIIWILRRFKLSNIKELFLNSFLTLIFYIISSFIFTWGFFKSNIFTMTYNNLFSSLITLKGISETNIWPNVLSSVAELNNASFNVIVNSVGGKMAFFIAFLGIVLLSLDYKLRDKRFKLMNRILLIFSIVWFYLIINKGFFIFLTANMPLLFLMVLFIPIGIALIFRLINYDHSNKVFFSILVSIWVAGTIYMSLNGVRFVLLLAPPISISFGLGLYYLGKIINNFFTKELKIKNEFKQKIGGIIVMSIIFLVLFNPMFTQAKAISNGTTPNFDDAWYGTMNKIKENSNESAIITSWWDFGHFFATVANRGVTFDGGSQSTPQALWVGKLLMENNERASQDILRMLVCGGNNAYKFMYEFVGKDNSDAVKINKILYKTFGKDFADTRNILVNNKYYNFTNEQIDTIMENLMCENPREDFLITSQDMVGKAGVWAHWGSWDFTKKFVYDNYKTMSSLEISNKIDENITLINKYVNELNGIEKRANSQNVKMKDLINQWFANYPSYIPIQGRYQYPCQSNNVSLVCQNGLIIDMNSGKVSVQENLKGQLSFRNLVYPSVSGKLSIIKQSKNGNVDVLLIPTGKSFNVMLMQNPLGASLFTKLFYLNGYGVKYFKKFDDVQSVTGVRVITWKVDWDIEKENIGKISGTNVKTISFNASKNEVKEIIGENISFDNNTN